MDKSERKREKKMHQSPNLMRKRVKERERKCLSQQKV